MYAIGRLIPTTACDPNYVSSINECRWSAEMLYTAVHCPRTTLKLAITDSSMPRHTSSPPCRVKNNNMNRVLMEQRGSKAQQDSSVHLAYGAVMEEMRRCSTSAHAS